MIGDLNNDGRSDLLWRNFSTGGNSIWLSGNRATQQAVVGVANLAWQVAGIGDFNGNSRSDIFWRNTSTGSNTIWLSANRETQQAVVGVPNLAWVVVP